MPAADQAELPSEGVAEDEPRRTERAAAG
jgi:hypothetical protein